MRPRIYISQEVSCNAFRDVRVILIAHLKSEIRFLRSFVLLL